MRGSFEGDAIEKEEEKGKRILKGLLVRKKESKEARVCVFFAKDFVSLKVMEKAPAKPVYL